MDKFRCRFSPRTAWRVKSEPCLAVVLAALAVTAVPAVRAADDESGGRYQYARMQEAPAMSGRIYGKLNEAQHFIAGKKYGLGLAVLNDLAQEKRLSSYETAQLYNYFAYTYFTLKRYKDAIRAYEKVLEQPNLPVALEQNSLYTLAQLYFLTKSYHQSVDTMHRWLSVVEKPTENAYMLLGQGYYELKEYHKSLDVLHKACKMVTDRGDKPEEGLLLLLRVDYFNISDYPNMLKVLKQLVALYPKYEYWLTLAGTYSEMKEYGKQLSVLQMLYENGYLQRPGDLLNLANLYLLNNVPYGAARVLDKAMKGGKIKKNVHNLSLLSQAWLQADEYRRSIKPLKQAARLSKDGQMDMRLAQAYLNLNRFQEAVQSLHTALNKGGLRRPDEANVMLGMAEVQLSNYDAARKAFKEAKSDKRSRKSAEQWLAYVSNEQARRKQLQESLEQY